MKTMTPVKLSDESTGDCPRCGERPAFPYKIPGVEQGYADSCTECAPVVVQDAADHEFGPFYTIYLTKNGRDHAEATLEMVERIAGCEVGLGDDFVNVHTTNEAKVHALVTYFGSNVVEVAGP